MKSLKAIRAVVCGAVLILTAVAVAREEPLEAWRLSTEAMIAALPDGVEGLVYFDCDRLGADESLFKEQVQGVAVVWDHSADERKTLWWDELLKAIREAEPRARVMGGSDFDGPHDVGVGNFNERYIWTVRKPLTGLIGRLTAAGDSPTLRSIRAGDVTLYSLPFVIRGAGAGEHEEVVEERWFAIPSPTVAVAAESRRDLEHMLASLAGGPRDMPPKWAEVATKPDLAAPLFVLRAFPGGDLTRAMGWFPNAVANGGVRVPAVGIYLPKVSERVLQVRCAAEQPADAEQALRKSFLPDDWFAWTTTKTSSGFTSRLDAKPGDGETGIPFAILLAMGVVVAL